MSKRVHGIVALVVMLLLTGAPWAGAQAPIKIGAFGPMTGGAAGYGQSEREAIDLVIEEVNAAGGVLGRKIEVLYGDDAGKPEQAVSIVKRFVTADEVVWRSAGSAAPPAWRCPR